MSTKLDQEMTDHADDFCWSCAEDGQSVEATTHSTNEDYAGYPLCAACADEYDKRAPIEPRI